MGIKNVEKIVKEMEKDMLRPDLIQDNKLHFVCSDNILRVRMPNQLEILQATEKKNQYEVKLINSDDTLTLKQLKARLKEKGVDVDAMYKELETLEKKTSLVYEKLVKRHDDDKKGIEKDEKEIDDIKKERNMVIDEISKRISPSIDIQAENYFVSYLTSVCSEKNVEGEKESSWVKLWDSFDDYLMEEDGNLKFYCMGYLSQLMAKVK